MACGEAQGAREGEGERRGLSIVVSKEVSGKRLKRMNHAMRTREGG